MDTRVRANPFPGLRSFVQEEADLFFGRDRQSDELVRRLAARRFLAVVGTSGSGKSSLVRAGLLPSLEGGFMAGAGAHWHIATLRPQDDPIGFLARAIVDTGVLAHLDLDPAAAEGVVETTLRRSSLGLLETTRLARLAPHENLLIIVDQFEELFRFADLAKQRDAGDEAPAFVKLLLEAAQQTDVPIYVVITMRSDFLGDCDRFRGLPEAISESQYLIPRLTRDELQTVITGPVGVRGGRIAPSLVQRLLNDVGDDMDQLPVLQHALMRAWDHWERTDPETRPIELSDLQAIGGMAEALSRHAEEAFASLATDRHRQIAERLFKCLTERGPDNREVRRPTAASRIAAIANADLTEVVQVIDVFRAPGCSFLMPAHHVALKGDSVIDISHESLIRQWGRLRTWVEQEAESRATYLRLVEAARLRRAGKAGLWGEPDLTYAWQWHEREAPNDTWAVRYAPGFDDVGAFLRESAAAHAAQVAEESRHAEVERMAKQRELEQAKELAEAQRQRADEQAVARIRQGRLSWGLAVIVVLALGAAGFGWREKGRAEESRSRLLQHLQEQLNSLDGGLAVYALEELSQESIDEQDAVRMVPAQNFASSQWFADVSFALDQLAHEHPNLRSWAQAVQQGLFTRLSNGSGFPPPPSAADDERLNPRITIKGGSFEMGSPADAADSNADERPPRRVTLSPFLIQEHEVTNAEYRRFAPSHDRGAPGDHPVVDVTWNDAMAYAAWLGGTLPSEAQWEFAARGSTGRTYPWGEERPTCGHGNFNACGGKLLAVKTGRDQGKTPEGVFDLAGNAWEWCRDWYGEVYSKDAQTDPLGPQIGSTRVSRGGYFGERPSFLRGAFRSFRYPLRGFDNHGFRVVWPAPAAPH